MELVIRRVREKSVEHNTRRSPFENLTHDCSRKSEQTTRKGEGGGQKSTENGLLADHHAAKGTTAIAATATVVATIRVLST